MAKEVVFILWDWRSGTTWITNIINSQVYYKEFFEPFHPIYWSAELSKFWSRYITPEENELQKIQKLIEWKIKNPRKDMSPSCDPSTENTLIKDIHCYLNFHWIYENFPHIKPIIIIRNPFATAISKYSTKSWWWEDELTLLLEKDIQNKFFSQYKNVIKKYGSQDDYVIKQILIWCLKYTLLLHSIPKKSQFIVRYEDLCLNFESEVSAIKSYISNPEITWSNRYHPSIVTKKTQDQLKKHSQIYEWKKLVSEDQLLIWKEIISLFGLNMFL